jgi:Domain of unknown function (DUF5615)
MKFKLDENVDLRIPTRFRSAGYDVATVPEQKMTSAPDNELIEVCRHSATDSNGTNRLICGNWYFSARIRDI